MVGMGPQVNRREMLDAILISQAWHQGVDVLELRSVKRVSSMFVVMETQFNRERPEDDAFIVSYIDQSSRLHRVEKYSRDDLGDLFNLMNSTGLSGDQTADETEEQYIERLKRMDEWEARMARVREVFPTPEASTTEKPLGMPDESTNTR